MSESIAAIKDKLKHCTDDELLSFVETYGSDTDDPLDKIRLVCVLIRKNHHIKPLGIMQAVGKLVNKQIVLIG